MTSGRRLYYYRQLRAIIHSEKLQCAPQLSEALRAGGTSDLAARNTSFPARR